ncbi:transketolase [Ornatilinea apprima]|uniref:Transketolase n=1 Tax=Ornatilinea apprima TaxID=1134406 RepID=A0A0P6X6M9_9CHLR|nr:transketolase [Ornatilinea apprima]KPL78719.1 transketolase [Ornatilinea apprima]
MDVKTLIQKSIQYRKRTLKAIKTANAGHTGGDLSCLDILNVLYNHVMNISPDNMQSPDRDRFIQSKGHSVEALYVVLSDKGFFPDSALDTICQYQSDFIGHPTRKIPGVEQNTGALGHGLSVAVGLALAAKMDERAYRVFTLMGDGELTEGSLWEASMSAAHYKLDNLVVIVDRNGLQITGKTEEVMALEPLGQKFEAFGYAVKTVDGNDIPALLNMFSQLPFEPGKPSLILASTVKGKGISFMEHKADWHHHVPTDEEMLIALRELDAALETQVG